MEPEVVKSISLLFRRADNHKQWLTTDGPLCPPHISDWAAQHFDITCNREAVHGLSIDRFMADGKLLSLFLFVGLEQMLQ